MKLKQLTIHLVTAVALSSTLLLSACGGGSSGDSGSNDNNKGQASASNNGFINVKGNNDLFPKCLSAQHSKDPAYLSCLSGEYKGINPAGKSCLVKFNGDSKSVSYKLENEVYNLAGSQFDWSQYTKFINNGSLALVMAFVEYKNDNELLFKYTQEEGLKAEITYGEFKSSCIISEYKLNK